MFDATTVSAIGTSLTSAATLTKAILGMKVDQEVMAKVIALQSEIMIAQSAALTSLAERAELMGRIERLEGDLRRQAGWATEAVRYRLTDFPTGSQVYVLKTEEVGQEPAHKICPHCYQNHKKSILQTIARVRNGEVVECPACKLRLELHASDRRIRPTVETGFY